MIFELGNSCLGSNRINSEEGMMGMASGPGPALAAQGMGYSPCTHGAYGSAVTITLCINCAL